MAEWYETFFGEDYERGWTFLDRPDRIHNEVQVVEDLLRAAGGADLLDAPCGWGRLAAPLARRGHRVTGVDRDPGHLARAARAEPALRLLEGDLRSLPVEDASFDGALNYFTSFGYFDRAGDLQVLAEFHRALRPGGRLVIETHNRDHVARHFPEQSWQRLSNGALMLKQRRFDPATDRLAVDVLCLHDGEERRTRFDATLYGAGELGRMLEGAGFRVERRVGLDDSGVAGEFAAHSPRFAISALRL